MPCGADCKIMVQSENDFESCKTGAGQALACSGLAWDRMAVVRNTGPSREGQEQPGHHRGVLAGPKLEGGLWRWERNHTLQAGEKMWMHAREAGCCLRMFHVFFVSPSSELFP